ncbi:MAG: TonB-dependent receptor [Mariniphaga sp.]|nr:TonB-dependent receptor [Mariniphaga sp.]
MKLSRLLFLIPFVFFTLQGWSQNGRLSLTADSISLQELFFSIERQTEYRFFYNNDEVDVSRKTIVGGYKKPVLKILAKAFENLPYSYKEQENKLILIELDEKKINRDIQKLPPASPPVIVTGKVTDTEGNPLSGVSVTVEKTRTGTITGNDGYFTLSVHGLSQTLVFSFVGMRTQVIPLKGQKFVQIALVEEAIGLEEIVVIGYGSVKKSDLTGSVSLVSSHELTRDPASDFTRALQGRAPGVMVIKSGSPGTSAQIRIRGIGSINHSSSPVYVIDGIITSSLAHINPVDIESIQVLKDASASAIYGADGANGVIIVKTRRGEKGETKLFLSSNYSLNRVSRQFEIMDAAEYSEFYKEILDAKGVMVPVAYEDHFRKWYYGEGWRKGTNWQDEISRPAIGQNHNLRISGGNDNSNYSISANYYKEEGILLSSSAERISLRANSDFQLGKFIKIGETINLSRITHDEPGTHEGNPWQISLISSPLMRVYNPNNKGGFEGPQIPYEYVSPDGESIIVVNTGFNDKVNPRAPLDLGDHKTFNNNVLASMYLEISPLQWLSFRSLGSADLSFDRTKNWFPAFDLGVRSKSQAQLIEQYFNQISLSFENQLTFSNSYGAHNITATVVHHVRKTEGNVMEANALGFPHEQLNVISQSYEDGRQVKGFYYPFASESYLSRIIYSYQNKYLITGSLRQDGNSRFGTNNRWGTFPSLSAAWKLNEDFFTKAEYLNILKLRLGWGRTGNSSIGNFQYMSLLDEFSNFSPVFGMDQKMVPALNVIHFFGNPSIKWEAAEMYNVGIDAALFDHKLQLTAEYYIKNQDDLLVKIPMSAAYGRVSGGGDPWVNLGELQNKGFEFTSVFRKFEGKLNYNVSGNFTLLKNRVKYLPGDILTDNNLTTIDHTIGSFYGYIAERILTPNDFHESGKYLHAMPATGKPQPGDLKFKDLNNDGTINDLDRTIIGKAFPDFIFSLNMETFFKNFDFSVFFYGMYNFNVYNHLRADIEGFSSQDIGHNKLKDYALHYYTPERPSTKYFQADLNNSNQNDRHSTWFLEEGSFIRLKDIQLGYSLPDRTLKKIGLSQVRLFLSAANIFTFTKYTGRDPESPNLSEPLNPGNDSGSYPIPSTITSGIQIGL